MQQIKRSFIYNTLISKIKGSLIFCRKIIDFLIVITFREKSCNNLLEVLLHGLKNKNLSLY